MQTGGTNRSKFGLSLPVTYALLSFLGIALFLYFYIFQVTSQFSLQRLFISFVCSGIAITLVFGLLIYRKKFAQTFEKFNFPLLFLQAFLLVCYFIFFIPKPVNHFFLKQINLQAEFYNETGTNTPVELLWINNGLRDISYSDIQIPPGTMVDNNAINLAYNTQGTTTFTWNGPAWDEITIVARSNQPFTAVYEINQEAFTFYYVPEINQDFRMQIPLDDPIIQTIDALTVYLSSLLTFSFLLFAIQIEISSANIKKRKIVIPQSVWVYLLAFPLLGVLIYLVRIGLYNRLYSDDYCYLTAVRDNGYFASVNEGLHVLNGRFMSHIGDYFLFIWDDALMPFGMLFSVLLLGGSLVFLFNQLIDIQNKRQKVLVSFILSAVVILTAFFIVPVIYESAFWALHTWMVCGGFAVFNTAMAVILRVSQKNPQRKKMFLSAAAIFILGIISCGFHENTGMLILLVTGTIWLLVRIFLPEQVVFRILSKLLFVYLLGSLTGFLSVVLSQGEQDRISGLIGSYAVDRTLYETLHLANIKVNILFDGFQQWGYFVIISAGLFFFLMGRLVAVTEAFSQIKVKHGSYALLLFLFPFILFVISFVPSTFIYNYYPDRTLIVPIYFFVLTFSMTAFFAGIQTRGSTTAAQDRIISLLAAYLIIIACIIHFVPLGSQFVHFAEEWDHRDQAIRTGAGMDLEEIQVEPYPHGFGVDISSTNNLFLSECYDRYYGIHVIPPQ